MILAVVLWVGVAGLIGLSGCQPSAGNAPKLSVDLSIDPSPPVVGDAEIQLKLTKPEGGPLTGANVQVEGNMNHAGMKPSFATLEEKEPGQYAGTLNFTMGGDWFLLITAKTSSGETLEEKIDVPGVKSK